MNLTAWVALAELVRMGRGEWRYRRLIEAIGGGRVRGRIGHPQARRRPRAGVARFDSIQ
jgi:hypothetical protein